MGDNNIIHADFIDETCFGYSCRTCGNVHLHGNGGAGFIDNRIEARGSHCDEGGDVLIRIDENTERQLNTTNMEIYLNAIQR